MEGKAKLKSMAVVIVMNILIKLAGFRGGAPFSMRQYQQVLRSEGYNCSVCGYMKPGNENENIFLDDSICYYVPLLEERSLVSVVKMALTLFKLMKRENAIMLLSPSRADFGVEYAVCCATGAAFLPVIPGGDIAKNAKNLAPVRKEKYICFSIENKEGLMANGIAEKNISVISNRIQAEPDETWRKYYAEKSIDQPLKILLVTRLDSAHKKGVLSFMDRIAKTEKQVILNIAGDGLCAEEYYSYAEKLGELNKRIYFLGYVKDMNSIILQADVIVGKGRSVITPIMMNRIGIVLGYDGGLTLCVEETFEELCRFNFSGRGVTHLLNDKEFFELCDRIRGDTAYLDQFERVFNMAREHYSIDSLPQKLLPIVNSKIAEVKRVEFGFPQKCKTVWLSICMYVQWLWAGVVAKMKG